MMNFLDETIKPFFYALETVDLQTIIIRCIKPHYARWKKYNFFLFFLLLIFDPFDLLLLQNSRNKELYILRTNQINNI